MIAISLPGLGEGTFTFDYKQRDSRKEVKTLVQGNRRQKKRGQRYIRYNKSQGSTLGSSFEDV